MAETERVTARTLRRPAKPLLRPVTLVRIALIAGFLAAWQALALSGLLFRDVVPPLQAIGHAMLVTLGDPAFYLHLYTTGYEIALAVLIGGLSGLVVGLVLGASPLMSRSYEIYLYYLGPCPKIIFFPLMMLWFGVGPGSKTAMGALSCFFPIALNVAAGMREIDSIYIRVGRSFRANTWQMVSKVYLPAMRYPVVNGLRLGLGVALIGTLLAETKLSNHGIGYLVTQAYNFFRMPEMYALLIILFVAAIDANALIGRLGGSDIGKRR